LVSLKELYKIYLSAKELLGLSIEEARRFPFVLLLDLLDEAIKEKRRELEELKEGIKGSGEDVPIEEELPPKVLSDVEKMIRDIMERKFSSKV